MNTTDPEHLWFHDQIATYLANGLRGEELMRFESHARECTDCSAELSEAKQLEQEMTTLFAATMPAANYEQDLIGRLQFSDRKRLLAIHPLVRRVAIAAAAAVLLGGFGLVGQEYLEHSRLPSFSSTRGQYSIALNSQNSQVDDLVTAVRGAASQPASSAERWDFGGGSNTSLNWSNWNKYQQQSADQNVQYGDGHVRFDTNPFTGKEAGSGVRSLAGDLAVNGGELSGKNTYAGKTIAERGRASLGTYFRPTDSRGRELSEARRNEVVLNLGTSVRDTDADFEGRAGQEQGQTQQDHYYFEMQNRGEAAAGVPASQPANGGGGAAATSTNFVSSRKVIREGTMEFEVDSFDSAFGTINKITAEEGGFIAAADSDKLPNGKVKGTITLRVPPDHLDTLVLKLRALGELKSQRLGSKDISKEYTDLESELRAAKAMEERLLDMIKNAQGKVKELLEAEKELSTWREKIEKIQGTMNYYNNLVSMATLTINAYEKDIKTPALASQTEQIDTGVETDDVEHARTEAIKSIDAAKGRIIESTLQQLEAGQLAAKVVAEVAPDQAGPIVDRLRQLGKIARLDIQRKQTEAKAQGTSSLGPAKVEQAPTRLIISMYNLANVAPRLTTNLNLAGDDVEGTYRAILARVAKSNGRVLSSNLNRQDATQASATIQFEVKAADADAVLNDARGAGQVLQMNVTENPDTANVTTAKQAFTVQIIPAVAVPPREVRTLSVQTSEVERVMQSLSSSATGAGGRTIESSLSQDQAGRQVARLVVEVPLGKADQLVDQARQDGRVRTAESSKNTQVPEGPLARARLNLTIGSGEGIVPGEHGFWDSIREGLGTSVKGLLWSLQLIVIGLCLVGPWVLLIWGGWRFARRGKKSVPVAT